MKDKHLNVNYDDIGTFIKESKNRFLCEVLVDNAIVECYIPSSCRLDNFLELKGKEVLLRRSKDPNARTKYSVISLPYKKSYIMLNTSMANIAIRDSIKSRRFAFLGNRKCVLSEKLIGNYKADIFIDSQVKTLIEIKSLISLAPVADFPTVYSERAIEQLKCLISMQSNEYRICYFIVSLNPYVKEIIINSRIKEYYCLLKLAQEKGAVIKAYSCKMNMGKLLIYKEINISFD